MFRSGLLRKLPVFAGPALLFAAVNCQANPLGVASGTMSATLQYRQPGQQTGCTYSGGASGACNYTNGTGFLPYNSSQGDQWDLVQADLSASLTSSVDSQGLHAQAYLGVSNEPLDPSLQHYWGSDADEGTASATWNDTLTISGSTPAYLVIGYSLDGSMSAGAHARADISESYAVYDFTSGYSLHDTDLFSTISAYGAPLNGPQNYLVYIPVTSGDQVSLMLQLQARVLFGCQAFSPILCTGGASADASHTLAFTQVGFQDNNGNWITGDTIASANGFDYSVFSPVNVSSAPEPGSMTYGALLLAAAAGLKFLRRRRERTA